MRYRNSECCITPEELAQNAVKTDCYGYGDNNRNNHMDWNSRDGWNMRDKYNDNKNKKDKCDENDKWDKKDKCDKVGWDDNNCDNCSEDLMRRLTELKFAAIDLNLYLDTHPCDEEALEMFKKITKTIKAVEMDYIRKYGPLTAGDSSSEVPFQWASCEFKWPWEK